MKTNNLLPVTHKGTDLDELIKDKNVLSNLIYDSDVETSHIIKYQVRYSATIIIITIIILILICYYIVKYFEQNCNLSYYFIS